MDLSNPLSSLIPSLDGEVLAILADSPIELPLRRVAAAVSRGSVSGVRLALQRLVAHGLATARPLGNAILFSANRDHLLWPAIELAHSARESLYLHISNQLGGWDSPPLSASVFGSVARGDSRPDSDIDLLLLWRDRPADSADDAQYDLSRNLTLMTGNSVQLYSLTRAELDDHVRAREPIVETWRKEARHLYGVPLIDEVKDAERRIQE
ncbi:nucleotidyltransferase family protein [Galbitalea soli]|uniref:Nucleotidyltransferase domain-containing protein n=1 Tax=Galbitalea soli TaxID=1268042 RepID=A0A7C9TRQ8_9MICO|nr:nucleotidyltransferase domain-containing protein [Galbitalea soli]NEM91895.1 nucleotidyltransferase domain-containing protein [Galbitalea soli]NYJ29268.1 putative nucleotidyltransferase [Galbitalea soli]